MRWELYERLFATAARYMRDRGLRSIDGRDAHDFAMDALRSEGVELRRLRFDMVDGIRRVVGRDGRPPRKPTRRFFDQNHSSRRLPPEPGWDWFDAWSARLTPRQREIALMLSSGLQKQQVASRIGVTPTRIGQIVEQIRRLVNRGLIVPGGGYAVQFSGAEKVHVREHAEDGEAMGEGDSVRRVASEEGSEEAVRKEASPMSLVPISEQTFVPIHRIERISFFGSHATVKYVDVRDVERIGAEDAVRLRSWIVGAMGPKMAFHRPPGRPKKKVT